MGLSARSASQLAEGSGGGRRALRLSVEELADRARNELGLLENRAVTGVGDANETCIRQHANKLLGKSRRRTYVVVSHDHQRGRAHPTEAAERVVSDVGLGLPYPSLGAL